LSIRNLKAIVDLPFKVNEFQDITDTLMRNDAGTWEPDRTPEEITHISIHHSAVEGATIESYARYHVGTLKWRSIGYHLVIKGDQVFQVNDLLSFTYHTSSNNGYTVGISISGDLSKRPLSEVERNNLYAAILTVMDLFKIPVENVLGHNQYPTNNTSCPCIDMDKVRSDIKNLQMQMQRDNSLGARRERAYAVKNEVDFMWGKVGKNDGDEEWSLNYLEAVRNIMIDQKLLK
jgi:hypothetical protein